MKLSLPLVVATFMFITVAAQSTNDILRNKIASIGSEKTGKCPLKLMAKAMCPNKIYDQCDNDTDCNGNGKCCSTGCAKVCVAPKQLGCELTKENALRRGRAIGMAEQEIDLLVCDTDGSFAPIQCQGDRCFCVNRETGFELPGTRARSIELVNCSEPLPCAGYVCRMLCPFGFELDDEGCPLCQCRDPCIGVKCPGTGSCVMEQMPCEEGSCPPLPTCREARTLDSLCPTGLPLTIGDEIKKPYLCGLEKNKPPCPPLYECIVSPGNDYGICCSAIEESAKPGLCPVEGHVYSGSSDGYDDVIRCGAECDQDFQCPSTQKCCTSDICGSHCVQPTNLTDCLKQRMIAELLITSEKKGKGYIPQCDPTTGHFVPKQCSRNGLVCWCSDPKGRKNPRSMSTADDVQCNDSRGKVTDECKEESECPIRCEYGYVVDSDGCDICLCDDPCDELSCPQNTNCVMVNDPNCAERMECSEIPTCIRNESSGINNRADLQCRTTFMETNLVNCEETAKCNDDQNCLEGQRCCFAEECHDYVCIGNSSSVVMNRYMEGPTMCEYIRDLVLKEGIEIALPTPTCDTNGAYESIQCNSLGQCWCIDGYGTPIPNTKVSARELANCERLENIMACEEFTCDLGCDYGYNLNPDSGCPMCECREPCKTIDCGLVHRCEMVNVPCLEGLCPPIPQCVPKEIEPASCVSGNPYIVIGSNITVTCNTRSRSLSCPVGYYCYSNENDIQGICCSNLDEPKDGQCPYLNLNGAENCDLECSEDTHCKGRMKCCSNGCGTVCVSPIKMTACQHQRALLEHRARESEIPANKVFLPVCNKDGTFAQTQCHPDTLTCWCVGKEGLEIPGTRVSSPAEPNCQTPLMCPAMNCNLACIHGYQIDTVGCPICACRNPCEEITCASDKEECRLVHVSCVKEPCLPIPVCLPKIENPCDIGSPLTVNGSVIECGPKGISCPSSHKCHLSPLGEYAKCCQKQRNVCFKWKDSGDCEGSITRWFFNVNDNKCKKFRYTACGGNLNNFESESECMGTCPPLTNCQLSRYQSLQNYEKKSKINMLPKCEKITGDWAPTQCLKEIGVCWCVTPTGQQIPGSLTRGVPSCNQPSFRSGRLIELPFSSKESTNMICEPGQTVHVCDKDLCENKICLSHPDTQCKINPCDGCSIYFINSSNQPVNCSSDLTDCQIQLQKILNSPAFSSLNKFGIQRIPSHLQSSIEHHQSGYNNKHSTKIEYDNGLDGIESQFGNEEIYKPVGILLEATQCHSDGSWTKEQRSGDFTWCINTRGEPIHETLTLGHVRCGPRGKILERMSMVSVCRDGISPLVCTDQCMNVTCDSHPDAVCAADPCDQCRISFYNRATGEKVHCDHKCFQPLNKGGCEKAIKRYFFNATSKECQYFSFGGCQGNDNNFENIQECKTECQNEVAVCEQQMKEGHCSGGDPRWFYNKYSRKCEPFLFSGCGGNKNNFSSKKTCEQMCPDLVACPYWTDFSKDPTICSRYQACKSQPCYGYADTYCKVDPCSCKAQIIDSLGQPATCMMYTKPNKTRLRFTYEEDETLSEPSAGRAAEEQRSVKIFIEGEPTFSRCQLLREHLIQTKSKNYIAQCDHNGEFHPAQCYNSPVMKFKTKDSLVTNPERLSKDKNGNSQNMNYINKIKNTFEESEFLSDVECWCVDEIGRRIQPTTYFSKGSYKCEFTPVESVFVTLGFRIENLPNRIKMDENKQYIGRQVGSLLKQLGAQTLEQEISIINLPTLTQIKFTLFGKNKIDVAYQLEDQIREGQLLLQLGEEGVIADAKASWFHYRVSQQKRKETNFKDKMQQTHLTEPREVVSRYVSAEHPYMAATVIFSVLTSLLVCGLVMSAVLYRRHIMTRNIKVSHGSLQSLTLSNESFYQNQWFSENRRKHGKIAPISSISTVEKEYNTYLD